MGACFLVDFLAEACFLNPGKALRNCSSEEEEEEAYSSKREVDKSCLSHSSPYSTDIYTDPGDLTPVKSLHQTYLLATIQWREYNNPAKFFKETMQFPFKYLNMLQFLASRHKILMLKARE